MANSCTVKFDLAAKTLQQHDLCLLSSAHFVEVGGSSISTADGLHISVIHAFCESMSETIESRPDQPIVICPADCDIGTVSDACQLCGAFVLLFEDAGLDAVLSTFKDALHGPLVERRTAIVDCWTALDRARALGWLGATGDDAGEPALDVEMASHYALASNVAECAGTLAAAWLMTGFGFSGGAAGAWVRMMCPGLLA